jgi:hypothetical protein
MIHLSVVQQGKPTHLSAVQQGKPPHPSPSARQF